ncbi:MAG TPA: alpha/beta hydrolase [Stellaceae bacterium]|nr:alpha/beta hydrolase [Stellaceae bacterium]
MTGFAERLVTIDGARVRALEAGEGPALVVIGRDAPDPLDALLARRAKVVIVPAAAGAAFSAARELGLDRFTPVVRGADATTMLALAAREPAQVRSVVLLGPTPPGAELAAAPMPVLALFGTRDTVSTREARRWRAGLADCHVVMVYDAGADPAVERPEAVADVVLDFLEHEDRFLVTHASGQLYP